MKKNILQIILGNTLDFAKKALFFFQNFLYATVNSLSKNALLVRGRLRRIASYGRDIRNVN